MTEQNNPDLMAQLAAQLAAIQQKPAAVGWNIPAMAAPAIQGVAVPIKVSTVKGEIRLYLQMPAECASSPDAIMQTLQALDSQGYPLDTWTPRNTGWGNSGNPGWGGGNRGGWRR